MATRTFPWFSPETVPRLAETAIDGRVLAFTLGISLFAGLVFGMAPAITPWSGKVLEMLKAETGISSPAPGPARLRAALAAAELALAVVLLSGAGIMVKSFWRMHARPAGFTPEKILVMRITLSGPQYSTCHPSRRTRRNCWRGCDPCRAWRQPESTRDR